MPDKRVTMEEALAPARRLHAESDMLMVPFNPQLINSGSKLSLVECRHGVSAREPSSACGRTLQIVLRRR